MADQELNQKLLDGLMKKCKKCKIEKSIEEYYTCSTKTKVYHEGICKDCKNKKARENYHKNIIKQRERGAKYRKNNPNNLKEYYIKHKDEWKIKNKEYYDLHREEINTSAKKYAAFHRKERRERYKKRIKYDIKYKIRNNLAKRIYSALKGTSKSRKTLDLLGCSVEEFKRYMEYKFIEGMNWENYGFGMDKWNIDHIILCARFNLLLEEEQRKCFHYTNLQPLWQLDNIKKGSKINA
jgi:hypothetical protein